MARLLSREEWFKHKRDATKTHEKEHDEEEERSARSERKRKRRRSRKEGSQVDTVVTPTYTQATDGGTIVEEQASNKRSKHVVNDKGFVSTALEEIGPKLRQVSETVWDEPIFLERIGQWMGPFVLEVE